MKKPTILIVDDEPKFLKSISLLLKKDFNVLKASNGKEGLSLFESNPEILMILIDLYMPVMNGVEMLERIREVDGDIKVIIITGKSTHDWAKKCADIDVQGYIEKPFDPKELIDRIKKLLGLKKIDTMQTSSLVKDYPSQAKKYIHENYHLPLQMSDIANHIGITRRHLSRTFKDTFQLTPISYLKHHRIKIAKEILKAKPVSIKKLVKMVGLNENSSSHFCREFKKHTSQSPSQFKKS